MATIKWGGTTSTDAEVAANWQGGTKPGAGDDVVFDATASDSCQLTANVSWKTVVSTGFGAKSFDLNGFKCSTSGAQNWDHAGTLDCDGEFEITGDANFAVAAALVTINNDDLCTVDLQGTGNFTIGEAAFDPKELICSYSGKTTTHNSSVIVTITKITTGGGTFVNSRALDIRGTTATIFSWDGGTTLQGSSDIDIRWDGGIGGEVTLPAISGAAYTGLLTIVPGKNTIKFNGNVNLGGAFRVHCFADNPSTVDFNGFSLTATGMALDAANAGRTLTIRFRNSTIDISGNFTSNSSNATSVINLYWDSASVYIGGSVTLSNTGTYTVFNTAALLELDGSTAATITSIGRAFPDIRINKSGNGVTLVDDLSCGDFNHHDGNFDEDGFDLDCIDLTISSTDTKTYDGTTTVTGNGDYNVSMTINRLILTSGTSHVFTSGITFTLTTYTAGDWGGTTLSADGATAWDFANPASMAVQCVTVGKSNATNVIDATHPTNHDSGGNTNWDFGTATSHDFMSFFMREFAK